MKRSRLEVKNFGPDFEWLAILFLAAILFLPFENRTFCPVFEWLGLA
jgi:hypothetical protein